MINFVGDDLSSLSVPFPGVHYLPQPSFHQLSKAWHPSVNPSYWNDKMFVARWDLHKFLIFYLLPMYLICFLKLTGNWHVVNNTLSF